MWTMNFQLFKLDLEKAEEQRSNCQHLLEHWKSKRVPENINFWFTDYAKDFDSVDHNKLWKILKEMGIPDHLTWLLRNLYAGQEATIRTVHGTIVQFSCSVMFNSLRPHVLQHARPPCPSPTARVHPNSCPLSRWCHPTISFSLIPFSSCPQSFPASGSFQMSQLFPLSGQSIGVSASASVLPMNIQDWSPLGWTGWISLQSKGLSRIFSNTIVQNHQFFCTQLSL